MLQSARAPGLPAHADMVSCKRCFTSAVYGDGYPLRLRNASADLRTN